MDLTKTSKIIFFYDKNTKNFELSNFYSSATLKIEFGGKTWKSSEHLYQALKFKNENEYEKEWREIIRTSNTPYISKYLGHQDTFVRYPWQQKYKEFVLKYQDKVRLIDNIADAEPRINIMRIALKAKFDSNPGLRELLKSTGEKKLGENCQCFWGYFGENHLGRLLEEQRKIYQTMLIIKIMR